MGGVVGGLVGGLLGGGGGLLGGILGGGGGLLSGLMSSVGGLVNNLVEKFGLDDVLQSVTNLAGDFLQNGLNSIIDGLPMPDFLKDMAKDLVGKVIGESQGEVPCDCQQAVNEDLGGPVKELIDQIIEHIKDEVAEEGKKENGGANGGQGSGHWIMILAKALGELSGQHMKKMVDLGTELSGMDHEEDPEGFALAMTEFQGASKLFSMVQETISTTLKTLGEGLNAMARKQ